MKLYAPTEYTKKTAEEIEKLTNGCGTRLDFVPDKLFFIVNIKPACQIHDFCYLIGETFEDKAQADRIFLNNILRIIKAKVRFFKFPFQFLAAVYYLAVVLFGGPAFWAGKNKDFEEIDL